MRQLEQVSFLLFCVHNLQKTRSSREEFGERENNFDDELSKFISELPFDLTEDQLKVLDEIKNDLALP